MFKITPILRTKLQPPQVLDKILHRERLLKLLNENMDKKLILICADAGYGKTTLLSLFCAKFDKPFIFYDLDDSDNDLAIFFNYIINGIQKYYPNFGQRTISVVSQVRQIGIIVGTFINEFIEQTSRFISANDVEGEAFYIVLDDYHYLQQNSEIANAVDYLLRHMPAKLHLIISSRSTPSLNLAHYLAKQELFKLEKEQLRFNFKEIKEFLQEVHNFKIPDIEIKQIEKHSDGWITAIQLILQKICINGAEKTRETMDSYLISGEDIFDYFAREVFESQSENIRGFLLQTSLLDALSADICDDLLNINASAKILHYLEVEHLFISRNNGKYKYHPLFRNFLYQKLCAEYPDKTIKKLHHRLGIYFLKNKNYDSAVKSFIDAENYKRAAHILESDFENWRSVGRYNAYIALVDRFPETVITCFPGLVLRKARLLEYMGRQEHVIRIMKPIFKRYKKTHNKRILADAYFIMGLYYLNLVDVRKALSYFRLSQRLTPSNDIDRKIEILLGYASSNRLIGRYKKTEFYLKEALNLTKKSNNLDLEIRVLTNLAYLCWAKYDYQKAEIIFSEIIERFEDKEIQCYDTGRIYADAAMVSLYNYNLAMAIRNLDKARLFAERFNDESVKAYCVFAEGDLYFTQQDYKKALKCYQQSAELNKHLNERLFELAILLSTVLTCLKLNRINECLINIGHFEKLVKATSHPSYQVGLHKLKGQIEFVRCRYKAAFDHFHQGLKISTKFHQPYLKMQIYYEMAKCCLSMNEPARALVWFRKSLNIGRANTYDSFFIHEGSGELAIIELAMEKGLFINYLTGILKKINTDDARYILTKINIKKGICDIECRFLGNLELIKEGKKIDSPRWRTQKCKAIFVYLVINQQRGCTKDELLEAFWPKSDLHHAMHSLQVEISSLRHLLTKYIDAEAKTKDLICFRNQRYFLNFSVKTDIQKFEELTNSALTKESVDIEGSIRLYKQALSLYRGDFCQDIAFDWCDNIGSYYKELFLKVLKNIGKLNFAKKVYEESLHYFRQALKLNAYDESIHVDIMHCYAAIGNRNALQKQYFELLKNLEKISISHPSIEAEQIFKKYCQ